MVSLLLTIILIALYLAVFAAWLSQDILTKVERDKFWISKDVTFLQWSFWLLPAAAAAQLLALVAVAAAAGGVCGAAEGNDAAEMKFCCCCCCGKKDYNAEVNMHDVMIY